jgi:hypothetical protein
MRRTSLSDTATDKRGGCCGRLNTLRVVFTCTKKNGVISPASTSSTRKSNVSHFSPRKCGQKYYGGKKVGQAFEPDSPGSSGSKA